MNTNRFMLASLVVFVFFFLAEWIFHGVILRVSYMEVQQLLRPEGEATGFMTWMVLGHLFMALMFCYLFTKNYENKGVAEGLRFGLIIGLLYGIPTSLINYAVQPWPMSIVLSWMIGYTMIFTMAGVVVSMVYRAKAEEAMA